MTALIGVFQAWCCHLQPLCAWSYFGDSAIEMSEAIISPSPLHPGICDEKIGWYHFELSPEELRTTFSTSSCTLLFALFGCGERCAIPGMGIVGYAYLQQSWNAAFSRLSWITYCRFNYCLGTFKLGILVGTQAASHQSCSVSGALWLPSGASAGVVDLQKWHMKTLRHRPGLGGGGSGLGYLKWVGDLDPPVLRTEHFEWQLGMWYTNLWEPDGVDLMSEGIYQGSKQFIEIIYFYL